MAESAPVVYIFHGGDEFGMAEAVAEMQAKLGDPSLAETNTSHLDGNSLSLDELTNAASALPFLTDRRLVVVSDATRKLNSGPLRERFLKLLDRLPQTTALVLLEDRGLKDGHWLLKWAKGAGQRAYVRKFGLREGGQLVNWIRERAASAGGEIAPQAAYLLTELIGEDTRMLAGEIEKLLAYVNYSRPIEVDDVQHSAAFAGGRGNYFTLIDTMSTENGREAMRTLRQLLTEQDPVHLYFSLVGHFRALLLTKEVLDEGKGEGDVTKELGYHPYRAKKLTAQARTLDMSTLEAIYRRLHDYDVQIKTGQVEAELALEMLVATLTTEAA